MNKAEQMGRSVGGRLRFVFNRLRENLWIRPLMICLLSLLAVFFAGLADHVDVLETVPEINSDALQTSLEIISSSMLVIAVFAVGSMLSAYASASSAATPRSFSLVVADDVSQNALSTFIGAFIFSMISLIALMNGVYEKPGRFVLFLFTIVVFAIVIISFVRWVDRIARLGRLGNTIDKVEAAAAKALRARAQRPTMGAAKADSLGVGLAVYSSSVGYVQRVALADLQLFAAQNDALVSVAALPGTFVSAGEPLAHLSLQQTSQEGELDLTEVVEAFVIGDDRTFDDDPRFGLIVLSEIASRALSPAVNDPGTAIDIIGTLVRLFTVWTNQCEQRDDDCVTFDRVQMLELSLNDMFDDAFNAIARDGASTLEVGIRLQKALRSLSLLNSDQLKNAAIGHAQLALRYAEQELKLPEELDSLRTVADWASSHQK